MKTRILCLMMSLVFTLALFAQQPVWEATSIPEARFRYNDIFFITPETGWAIRPYEHYFDTIEYGAIFKTTDGGSSWLTQVDSSHIHFRCMGFADSQHGWVFSLGGLADSDSLGYDTTLVVETTDGGATWFTPKLNIDGPMPRGLCGMSVVNRDVVYACGRWGGPAFLMKTTNSGKDWKSINMSSASVGMLIDCHFWSPDSGIVVGGTNTYYPLCQAIVLFTSDGGASWVKRHHSSEYSETCWKVDFPSRNVGYAALQSYPGKAIIKTTDGGMTWQRKALPKWNGGLQGIGFVNDSVGWTGGWEGDALQTTTGGDSWELPFIGQNVNRFRFIGDSIGYCAGKSVFKMTMEQSGSVKNKAPFVSGNYPNPFETETTIHFSLENDEHVFLQVSNMLGTFVETLIDKQLPRGAYDFPLIPEASGMYFYILRCGDQVSKHAMLKF